MATADIEQLDKLIAVLTLCLDSQEEPTALHDARTFSVLLCASRRLRDALLPAAAGRLTLAFNQWQLPRQRSHDLVRWLQQHVLLGTLGSLQSDVPFVPLLDFVACHEQAAVEAMMATLNYSVLPRVVCTLADAAAWGLGRMPVVDRVFAPELQPATWSQLPGGHLTQLTLSAEQADCVCWQELARLTSLQELRLPRLQGEAPNDVAPAVSALSRLTGLLLADPPQDVCSSLPDSLESLVLIQPVTHWRSVRLAHLTRLHTLALGKLEEVPPEEQQPFHLGAPGGQLQDNAELPTSLQRLLVDGVSVARPLLKLPQLSFLQIRQFPGGMDRIQLLQLRSSTALTRVEFLQGPNSLMSLMHVPTLSLAPLPIHVPSLSLQVPRTFKKASRIARAFGALADLTSLTRLSISRERGRRAAAILTAAAAAGGNGVGEGGAWNGTAEQLAAALLPLTNLQVLQLSAVPSAADSSWLPAVEAVAALPKLQQLQINAMPLAQSARALAAAQRLTSLSLSYCQVDTPTVAALSALAQFGTCLRQLTLNAPQPQLQDAALLAITQHMTQLRQLELTGAEFSPAALAQLSRLQHLEEARF